MSTNPLQNKGNDTDESYVFYLLFRVLTSAPNDQNLFQIIDDIIREGFSTILFTLFVIVLTTVWIYSLTVLDYNSNFIAGTIIFFLGNLVPAILILISYCHKSNEYFGRQIFHVVSERFCEFLRKNLNVFEGSYIICGTLSIGLTLLSLDMNHSDDFNFMLITPFIFTSVVSSPNAMYSCISWFISFVIAIISRYTLVDQGAPFAYMILAFLLVGIATIALEVQKHKMALQIFTLQKFHQDLERTELTNQSRILRDIISNVSHDMLSPLQALESGLEAVLLSYEEEAAESRTSRKSSKKLSSLPNVVNANPDHRGIGFQSQQLQPSEAIQTISAQSTSNSNKNIQFSSAMSTTGSVATTLDDFLRLSTYSRRLSISSLPSGGTSSVKASSAKQMSMKTITENEGEGNGEQKNQSEAVHRIGGSIGVTSSLANPDKVAETSHLSSQPVFQTKYGLSTIVTRSNMQHFHPDFIIGKRLPPKELSGMNIASTGLINISSKHFPTSPISAMQSAYDHSDERVSQYTHVVKRDKARRKEQQEIIQAMQNTLSFMAMIIGRSLDVSKSTGGMSLVPNYESFNIKNSINKVVKCVVGMETDARIDVEFLPNDASYVGNTDKRWFEGNFLCIVSNAAKYSMKLDKESISVRVSLYSKTTSLIEIEYGPNFLPAKSGCNNTRSSVHLDNIATPTEKFNRHMYTSMKNHQAVGGSMKSFISRDSSRSHGSISVKRPSGVVNLTGTVAVTDHPCYDFRRQQQQQQQYIKIEVTDSGDPLTNVKLDNFFTAAEAGSRSQVGGMGLGLFALAKRIEALNGSYGVHPRKDGLCTGYTVWFEFPLKNNLEDITGPETYRTENYVKTSPRMEMENVQESYHDEVMSSLPEYMAEKMRSPSNAVNYDVAYYDGSLHNIYSHRSPHSPFDETLYDTSNKIETDIENPVTSMLPETASSSNTLESRRDSRYDNTYHYDQKFTSSSGKSFLSVHIKEEYNTFMPPPTSGCSSSSSHLLPPAIATKQPLPSSLRSSKNQYNSNLLLSAPLTSTYENMNSQFHSSAPLTQPTPVRPPRVQRFTQSLQSSPTPSPPKPMAHTLTHKNKTSFPQQISPSASSSGNDSTMTKLFASNTLYYNDKSALRLDDMSVSKSSTSSVHSKSSPYENRSSSSSKMRRTQLHENSDRHCSNPDTHSNSHTSSVQKSTIVSESSPEVSAAAAVTTTTDVTNLNLPSQTLTGDVITISSKSSSFSSLKSDGIPTSAKGLGLVLAGTGVTQEKSFETEGINILNPYEHYPYRRHSFASGDLSIINEERHSEIDMNTVSSADIKSRTFDNSSKSHELHHYYQRSISTEPLGNIYEGTMVIPELHSRFYNSTNSTALLNFNQSSSSSTFTFMTNATSNSNDNKNGFINSKSDSQVNNTLKVENTVASNSSNMSSNHKTGIKRKVDSLPLAPISSQISLPVISNLRTLVVDDSLPIVRMTQIILEKAGHHVETAKNGKIGLDMMKAREFDVVLMDIQMPVMGGLECVSLLRQFEEKCFQNRNDQRTAGTSSSSSAAVSTNSRKQRQLIIGMSANGDQKTRLQAFESGMNAFVPKPFSLEVIMKVVTEHIHKITTSKMSSSSNPPAVPMNNAVYRVPTNFHNIESSEDYKTDSDS